MSQEQDKYIKIQISGRVLPLKVKAEEEAAVRRIAAELNAQIHSYQSTYRQSDKQDVLSMLLLKYAFELHQARQGGTAPLPDMAALEALLDEYLDAP